MERQGGRDRLCLTAGALLGASGVAAGAFAAHGLRAMLDPQALDWWHTAVQYQMWHAVALAAFATVPNARTPGLLAATGTLLFSGSLYIMALSGARWLGAVTPVGGMLMIAAWLLLAWRGWRTV